MITRGGPPPPRREALINLAREPNPTRETGVGTREVEEVAEETAEKRKGRGEGGREEAEDDDGGGGVLSSAIGGKRPGTESGDGYRGSSAIIGAESSFFFPFFFPLFFDE